MSCENKILRQIHKGTSACYWRLYVFLQPENITHEFIIKISKTGKLITLASYKLFFLQ